MVHDLVHSMPLARWPLPGSGFWWPPGWLLVGALSSRRGLKGSWSLSGCYPTVGGGNDPAEFYPCPTFCRTPIWRYIPPSIRTSFCLWWLESLPTSSNLIGEIQPWTNHPYPPHRYRLVNSSPLTFCFSNLASLNEKLFSWCWRANCQLYSPLRKTLDFLNVVRAIFKPSMTILTLPNLITETVILHAMYN